MEYTGVERLFRVPEQEAVSTRFKLRLAGIVIVILALASAMAVMLPLASSAARLSMGATILGTGASLLVVMPLIKRVERIAALATPSMQFISRTGGGELYRRNSDVVREMREDARKGVAGAALFLAAGAIQVAALLR